MTDSGKPAKKPLTPTGMIVAVVATIVVVITCVVGCVNRQQDRDREGRSVDAKVTCRQFVERRLVSPASADYSGEVVVWDRAANVYTVTGQVDAMNALGVPLRRSFRCEVFPTGDDQWKLRALTGLD